MVDALVQAFRDDLVGIGMTLGAIAGVVLLAEVLGARGVRAEHSRKTVHVLGGLWCVSLPWLLTHLASVVMMGAIIAGVFEIARRSGRLRGLHGVDRSSWGPTLFPVGVVVTAALTWQATPLFVASVLILTLGDAAAALLGETFGRRRYSLGTHHRTIEGSATLFAIAAVVGTVTLGITSTVPWMDAVAFGLLLAASISAVEGISPMGLDNVAVPVASALFLLHVASGRANLGQMALAAGLTTLVVGVSLWRRHLTGSGALAAWVLGFSLAVAGGWAWFVAALFVFAAVNVASRFRRSEKRFDTKGATRDHQQLLANAGLAIPAALVFSATGHPAALGAFLGAFAFAGADTLASEVGVLSRVAPRAITTGKPVPSGTSGGVTAVGYAAAAVGAVLPALGLSLGMASLSLTWIGVALVAGLVGCTVDSVLGDVWQARFACAACGKETERRVHCGAPTRRTRGVPWMDNDGVNLLGSAASALVGMSLAWGVVA